MHEPTALPVAGVVVVLYRKDVGARLQTGLHSAPEFLEVGQPRGAHPDDEVLVLGVNPLSGLAVGGSLVLVTLVARPGDARLVDGDQGGVRVREGEVIVEECFSCIMLLVPIAPHGLATSEPLRGLPPQLALTPIC